MAPKSHVCDHFPLDTAMNWGKFRHNYHIASDCHIAGFTSPHLIIPLIYPHHCWLESPPSNAEPRSPRKASDFPRVCAKERRSARDLDDFDVTSWRRARRARRAWVCPCFGAKGEGSKPRPYDWGKKHSAIPAILGYYVGTRVLTHNQLPGGPRIFKWFIIIFLSSNPYIYMLCNIYIYIDIYE